MTKFLTLTPVQILFEHISAFAPVPWEEVALEEALGRILAESFVSEEDLPGFDRSTVDGFAVRARDLFGAGENAPILLDCLGEIPMGTVSHLTVTPGGCVRIWTGGMLPEGADAVVMLEYARAVGRESVPGAQVELTRPLAPGDNVLVRDEDCARGQTLIPQGRMLRPQELGLLAALGQERVRVRAKPKVAVISTGDEVVPFSCRPKPGQVRDVNSCTLSALARSEGAEARFFGLVGDRKNDLQAIVDEALDWSDVVLVSGGSSAGQRDYTLSCFSAIPGCVVLAHGVAISPGKPLIFARTEKKSLWGIPGHVSSALVCAQVFLRPLLGQLLGRAQDADRSPGNTVTARLVRPVPSVLGRRDYIRVALEPPAQPNDIPLARPVLGKSGIISTLVRADGLTVCPEEAEGLAAGAVLEVFLLRR